ncbi:MAG: multiheme c-type cytochrome [Myxococcota bacterium]|nr:multiheme c-type cytochrome [Myxococcota bacterium]
MSLNAKRIVVALLSFLFLVTLIVVAWVEGVRERLVDEAVPVLSGENERCYTCHKEKTPGVTDQWADSTHAETGVGCYDCHQAEEGDPDAWHHEGRVIATLVTPNDCGRCHKDIAAEFQGSHHAKAGQILGSLDNVLGETVEGPAAAHAGCQQCHGSKVAFQKDAQGVVIKDKNGKPMLDTATWPNSGIGRINPDGSIGTCSACHSRHRFSIEMARRPDNCGKCHLGPDHPQKEIYEESKHGIAFVTADQQGKMHLGEQAWVVGKTYSAAPTCATCHLSATATQQASHNPGKRITWTLRPAISKRQDKWEQKKLAMQDVCSSCHAPDWIAGHYDQYDAAVHLYNDKFGKPAKQIMDALRQAGLLTKTPFDEKIEWTYFYLWHHEGRRARMGASMMAPDYTQWHGFFEIAERFYQELIPEAVELAHERTEVQAVIAKVLAAEPHRWQKGLSAEAAAQVEQFYQKRYGHAGLGSAGDGKPTTGASPDGKRAVPTPKVQPAPAAEKGADP